MMGGSITGWGGGTDVVSTSALTLVPWGRKPGLEPDRPHGHGVSGRGEAS